MRIPLLNKLVEGTEQRVVERAERQIAQGKFDRAGEVFRAGLARSPGSVPLHLGLARALALSDRENEAAATLRALLRAVPDGTDAVRELAEMGRLQGLDVSYVHDVLAEHGLRLGRLADCSEQMEKLDRSALARFSGVHRKRFLAGIKGREGKISRSTLLSGSYVAMAHIAAAEDGKALEVLSRILDLDPSLYCLFESTLCALAARNYRSTTLLLGVLDLHLANGNGPRVAQEAERMLRAAPGVAAGMMERLGARLAERPDEPEVRLVLAKANWAAERPTDAVALLDPLVEAGEHDALLDQLLTAWRVDRPEMADVGLLRAEILGRNGQGPRAIQALAEVAERLPRERVLPVLDRLIERWPGEARAYEVLADLRAKQGDMTGAVAAVAAMREQAPEQAADSARFLRSMLEEDPRHPEAHRLLVQTHLERGEVQQGLTVLRHLIHMEPEAASEFCGPLEKVASANPASVPARLGAAEAWLSAGQPERALPHLSAALELQGAAAQVAHRVSLILRRYPDRVADLTPLADAMRGRLTNPAAVLYLQAECATAARRPEQAADLLGEAYGLDRDGAGDVVIELLERLLSAHPSASAPRMLMANILVDRGEPLRAVDAVTGIPEPDPGLIALLLDRLEAALPKRPDDPRLRTGLARILLVAGRPNEALKMADDALRVGGNRGSGTLHLVRGESLLAVGERAKGVQSLTRAAHSDSKLSATVIDKLRGCVVAEPRDGWARLALGRLLIGAGEVREGLDLLVELPSLCPQRAADAVRAIDAAAEELDGDPLPLLAAARLLGTAGEPAAAAERIAAALTCGARVEGERLLEELLGEHPDQPDLLFTLGLAREDRDSAEACRLLERSAGRDEDAAKRALTALRRVAAAHPGDPEPCLAAARIHRAGGNARAAFQAMTPLLGEAILPDEAVDLLQVIHDMLSNDPEPALALARALLARSRDAAALQVLFQARQAGARADVLETLLDRILESSDAPVEASLMRAGILSELGKPDRAVQDLRQVADRGEDAAACQAVAEILGPNPRHAGARRLHVDLLLRLGLRDDAVRSLDAGLAVAPEPATRCDLFLERAELRMASGDAGGASEDLRAAEELAADRDKFLERVHARRRRRQESQLVGAEAGERVRLLMELGRLEEAEVEIADAELPPEEVRVLRAALLLARGEAAAGLKLMRSAPPVGLLVDAAQRCDQPGLALAALDRILEEREDAGLREARGRLAEDLWRLDLAKGGQALVARIAFVPREDC